MPRSALAVPEEVKAVVRLLMAKRPEDRIQTPGELATILAGIEADLPKALKGDEWVAVNAVVAGARVQGSDSTAPGSSRSASAKPASPKGLSPKSLSPRSPTKTELSPRPIAPPRHPVKAGSGSEKLQAAGGPADSTIVFEPGSRAPAVAPIITLPSRTYRSQAKRGQPRPPRVSKRLEGADKADREAAADSQNTESAEPVSKMRSKRPKISMHCRALTIALAIGVILLGMLVSGLGRMRRAAEATPAENDKQPTSKPG